MFLTEIPGGSAMDADRARGPLTAAERTAATMVGESAPTGVEGSATPHIVAPSGDIASQAGTMPTVLARSKEAAAPATMLSLPGGAVAQSPLQSSAPAARRSSMPLIAVGVVVLLLVVGAAGYAVIHFMGKSADNTAARTDSSKDKNGASGSDLAAGAHEIGRYWVEVNTPNKAEAILAGESLSMKSLQEFKFHFSPSENGYLYIIGPGTNNVPTAFLTAKPDPRFGVKTNEVKSGQDFAFPAETKNTTNWITLDQTSGTDEYTIIFSPRAMEGLDFLNGPALHELTPAEQKQLASLRQQARANSVAGDVIKTGASPFVSVKVPQNAEGSPVIFTVRLEHK
jgi:hypothetical protein